MKLPRPLSHSSITLYTECPQKYKFKYVDKIPEKPRHFFSFGSSVHLALEFFYGAKEPPAPSLLELLRHYKEIWISAGYKDAGQEAEYFQDGKDILTAFHKKHSDTYEVPFSVEYHFNLLVGSVPVTGKIDRVDKLPDGRLAILDYKTGKSIPSARIAEDAQLTMYQLACEQTLGAKVGRLTLYHLPTLKEHVTERHDAGLVENLSKKIVHTAASIEGERFPPLPEERKCMWCDYKPLCPVFKSQFPTAPLPAAAGPAGADAELAELVDRYGALLSDAEKLKAEAAALKGKILALLLEKGFIRVFGKRYELTRTSLEKWDFTDRKRVVDIIRRAGLYEKILAPSSPLVAQLMDDLKAPPDIRKELSALARKVEEVELTLKPLPEES